ncbi:MAG: hypothetical protein WC868_07095 [Bacteroidales bacterium]
MPKFALKCIQEITGKIKFYSLVINGISEFDVFFNSINSDKILRKQLSRIQSICEQLSDIKSLPEEKFRQILPIEDNVKAYEIKTRDLRVYLFHLNKIGYIIVCGGKKNNQDDDVRQFKSIKKSYLQFQSLIKK